MKSIEVRMKALSMTSNPDTHVESSSFFLDSVPPKTASGILNQLREMSAIKSYILEQGIAANPDTLPTIYSPMNDDGEFYISLPTTTRSDQIFKIWLIN